MYESLCVVLGVLLMVAFAVANEKQGIYEKECQAKMEADREIGRLIAEIDRLRSKHHDYS